MSVLSLGLIIISFTKNGKSTIMNELSFMPSIRCKKASDIIDEINETVNQWKGFDDEVGVDADLRDRGDVGGCWEMR